MTTQAQGSASAALRLAKRMDDIAPFFVMEIQRRAFELERSGRRIVHMEIGQPDFGAPPSVVASARAALASERMGYTDSLGIWPLREAIARFYAERYGVDIAPERVIVTAGASGAFLLAFGTLFDPADELLLPDPCYPCNRHFARMFEARAHMIPMGPESRYQLLPEHLDEHWNERTRGVMLASPSNPTGTCVPMASLEAIAERARNRGGLLIVDEIYQGLRYDGAEQTALSAAPEAIVINSFSKYFSMTGWRIGWMVVPDVLVRGIERFAQNAFICPSAPAQHAALAALEAPALEEFELRRQEFARRRDFIVPALEEMGFRIRVRPEGAFYVYADCSALTLDSGTFAFEVLESAGVAITPGRDFGHHLPGRHVRFAYTRSLAELEEGCHRLRAFVRAGS